MLKQIKKLIGSLADSSSPALAQEDYKLAGAALLVHATLADGHADPQEMKKLRHLLHDHYNIDEQGLDEFIALARQREKEAIDLYRFTRLLTRHLDETGRMEMVEMLWEIAFADGVIHEYENHLVWRVAELLHVTTRDRVRLRKKVEARNAGS